ncbi:MAG: hypothetical protein LJE90_14680 [Betaproteobacteria bacterium]|nr:hypothetical protein [Betaproteobacteria bacterium]
MDRPTPRRFHATTDVESELLDAVRRAREGDWHGAHEIVQRHEGDARADWIHAVLHRIEGDSGNAEYWYRRCASVASRAASPQAELALIAEVLSASTTRPAADARGTAP